MINSHPKQIKLKYSQQNDHDWYNWTNAVGQNWKDAYTNESGWRAMRGDMYVCIFNDMLNRCAYMVHCQGGSEMINGKNYEGYVLNQEELKILSLESALLASEQDG